MFDLLFYFFYQRDPSIFFFVNKEFAELEDVIWLNDLWMV